MTFTFPQLVKLSTTLALLGGLAACSHAKPVTSSEPAPTPAAAAEPAATPAPAAATAAAPEPAATVAVRGESVYFDFDQSQLKGTGQDYLSGFGALLARHPDLKVRIEGNCDERGTSAYNMALGAKRAEAAKAYLVQMGAQDSQITTVSYGKERPKAKGHDEAAWAENRRDDVVPSQATVSANP